MKKSRREVITVEDLLQYLDEECDDEAPQIELIKQVLEQLDEGQAVEPGDEFMTPGFILVIEDDLEE